MSIAVSARIKPSRAVRLLLGAGAIGLLAAALAVGLVAPDDFIAAPLQALALAAAGTALLGSALAPAKTHRLDISGTGELRVTVQQDVGGQAVDGRAGETVRDVTQTLLPGSFVWPMLIGLRHAVPGARARTLLIARDSVDAATWRALVVALAVVGRAGVRTTDATTR
jgi:hypothetical protein